MEHKNRENKGETPGHLILFGMQNCGKTSLGRLLAERLELPFLDLEDLIEGVHDSSRSYSCQQIHDQYGAEYFKQCETAAAKLLPLPGCTGKRFIITLGDETPENREAMKYIQPLGELIYIQEDPDILRSRIKAKGLPPELRMENPEEIFFSQFTEREQIYRSYAHKTVFIQGKPLEKAVILLEQTALHSFLVSGEMTGVINEERKIER